MKVFLVEDSAPIVARLQDLLATLPGTSVVGHAATADAAIAAIPAERPDIVLLDIALADGTTGFDVLRALRPGMPDTGFYMLSNHAAYPYRQLAERLGARGFFDKTKDIERVSDLMQGRRLCLPSSC
jgi:DNA-binding NarL/FixJ family response regulator